MSEAHNNCKFGPNKDITLQVVSQTGHMHVAKVWFSGKGFDEPDHRPLNEEVDIVVFGQFRATGGGKERVLNPGISVHVPPNDKHSIQLLSPTGKICSRWMPPREDLIEKLAGLEE